MRFENIAPSAIAKVYRVIVSLTGKQDFTANFCILRRDLSFVFNERVSGKSITVAE
ncbi:MAG: hypothetical protein KGZ71_12085 [Desulfobulbaceae bacterium]|nr:hypothetical protein [Desulfobulbaceae bacterium]